MFAAMEIVDIAIRIENSGEAVYRDAIEKLTDPDLISLLQWLADDEARHVKWFSELKQDLQQGAANPFMEEMTSGLLDDLLGNQSFSLGDVDFPQLKNVYELASRAIEFEKDSILFYEMLAPFVEDPTAKQKLAQIIDEEKRHVEQLRKLLSDKSSISDQIFVTE